MKPNQSNGKLQLKKQAISNLSNSDLENLKGGLNAPAFTTSQGGCTGALCCGATQTCTIIEITTIILKTLLPR